jgi:hypothetical protein
MSTPTSRRLTSMRSTSPLRRVLRRVAITVAGTAVVAAGIAMLVLPGPGLVTIALGLSLLGREHAWAAALERRARARVAAAARRVREAAGSGSVPVGIEVHHLGEADVVARRVPERGVDAVGLGRGRVVERDAA